MSAAWPERRPAYVPLAVWEFAKELRGGRTPEETAVVARLMGPDMAPTWEKLGRRIGLARCPVADHSWSLLLEAFYTSCHANAVTRNGRQAYRETRDVLKDIAYLAGALAEQVEYLTFMTEREDLAVPAELCNLKALLHRAASGQTRPRFASLVAGLPGWQDAEPHRFPSPADLVQRLAAVAREAEPDLLNPYQARAKARKTGVVSDWVRAFDIRFLTDYRPLLAVPDLTIGAEDTARIGCAVLGPDVRVTPEAVKAARYRAT